MNFVPRRVRPALVALGCTAFGVLAGYVAWATANVPAGLSYSGTLRNHGVVDSNPHDFVFELWDGASVQCTDSRAGLPVSGGRFDVSNLFGQGCALDSVLATHPSLFVRITVDGQVLSPPQPLGAVPFAARARVAESCESCAGSNAVSASQTLSPGQCLALDHGFNTYAVSYQAWMTDAGNVVPVPAAATAGGATNLALGRSVSCSSVYAGSNYLCPNLVDGTRAKRWYTCNGCGLGSAIVDLGSLQTIDHVVVQSDATPDHDSAYSWNVQLSVDGSLYVTVGTGSCLFGGSCDGPVATAFPATAARYVRLVATGLSPVGNYTGFAELEVFGPAAPVRLASVNQALLCNYTGVTRDFTLAVSH